MKIEKECEHPLRATKTIVITGYCRICGYTKTITATKDYENLEEIDKDK